MKKILMFALVLSVLAMTPVIASAASVEGSIQGYQCVTQGTTCPVGMEDPMAAVEDVFVLLEKSGKYYFVPNVDRAVLARHINERVKISGSMSDKYNSITADQIDAFQGGNWKTVWTTKWESQILRKLAP